MRKLLSSLSLMPVYSIIVMIFVIGIGSNNITADLLYLDLYLFFVVILMYGYMIFNNQINSLQMYRFRTVERYFIYKFIHYSTENLCMIIFMTAVNCAVYMITNTPIDFGLTVHYTVHLFMVFEIVYLFSLAAQLYKNSIQLQYMILFVCCLMFLICSFSGDQNVMVLNVFTPYFMNMHLYQTVLHYALWVILPVLLIFRKKERLEI